MIDYKKQEFEEVLKDDDFVLGTVRGDAIEKSLQILKPNSKVPGVTGFARLAAKVVVDSRYSKHF